MKGFFLHGCTVGGRRSTVGAGPSKHSHSKCLMDLTRGNKPDPSGLGFGYHSQFAYNSAVIGLRCCRDQLVRWFLCDSFSGTGGWAKDTLSMTPLRRQFVAGGPCDTPPKECIDVHDLPVRFISSIVYLVRKLPLVTDSRKQCHGVLSSVRVLGTHLGWLLGQVQVVIEERGFAPLRENFQPNPFRSVRTVWDGFLPRCRNLGPTSQLE